jgi:hypothetical protein
MRESDTNDVIYPDLEPKVGSKRPNESLNSTEVQANLIKALRRQLKETLTSAKEHTATYCPHGRKKTSCKECGGASFCAHGRFKYRYYRPLIKRE